MVADQHGSWFRDVQKRSQLKQQRLLMGERSNHRTIKGQAEAAVLSQLAVTHPHSICRGRVSRVFRRTKSTGQKKYAIHRLFRFLGSSCWQLPTLQRWIKSNQELHAAKELVLSAYYDARRSLHAPLRRSAASRNLQLCDLCQCWQLCGFFFGACCVALSNANKMASRLLKDMPSLAFSQWPLPIFQVAPNVERNRFGVLVASSAQSPYGRSIWLVTIELPRDYPHSSPSVAFATKPFHCNVEASVGAVCLDSLSASEWTPAQNLEQIFLVSLP